MTVRYLADLHFDDEDIIAYDNRPFDSADEMNQALISNWNRVVSPDDLTWILGDFCHSREAERWAAFLDRLNGRKSLILGNHDDPAAAAALRDRFEEVTEYREILDDGRHVVLCHYPILAFHGLYEGWIHLYGHVHSAFDWNVTQNARRQLKKLYMKDDCCRMLNVGSMMSYMDYTPRRLDELLPLL